MIKRFLVVFAVCFMLMPALGAQANLIMGPRGPQNSFLLQHKNELVRLGRHFFTNSESGFVSVKDAPNSNIEIAILENNQVRSISYTYNYQGELWGFLYHVYFSQHAEFTSRGRLFYGWVPMNQLLLRYDRISFTEEHQDEFYPFTGSYEALKTADEIVLWEWPGSGIIRRTLETTQIERFINENITPSKAFRDEQGCEWAFFERFPLGRGYAFNVWINLSDPSNSDIPAFNPPRPMAWQSAGAEISTVADISINTDNPTSEPPISELIIILVAGLSVSTATLIRVFWKPNKRA